LFDRVSDFAGRVVLDVGCGASTSPAKFISQVPDLLYVGIDISHGLLRRAAENMPHGVFLCANAARLPLKHGVADVVLSLGFMHHLPDPIEYLAQLALVHNGTGPLLLREPSLRAFGRGHGMSPNEEGLDDVQFMNRARQCGYRFKRLVYLNSRVANRLRRLMNEHSGSWLERYRAAMESKVLIDRFLDITLGRLIPSLFHGLDFFAVLEMNVRKTAQALAWPAELMDPVEAIARILICPACGGGPVDVMPAALSCQNCAAQYRRDGRIVFLREPAALG
jgi:SAM-dependent methyltransferase